MVFQLTLFMSAFFGLISALSPNIYVFIFLRFLLGVGYGGSIVTDVVLLAEMLPARNRGRYLCMIDIFFSCGTGCMFVFCLLGHLCLTVV